MCFLYQLISELGNKKPESFRKLYPKAKNKAIQLLERILVLDPNKRMSVDKALKHPYLSTYHDPDDEPVCMPAFDFSFETQVILVCVKESRPLITKLYEKSNLTPKSHLFNLVCVCYACNRENKITTLADKKLLDISVLQVVQRIIYFQCLLVVCSCTFYNLNLQSLLFSNLPEVDP